MWRLLYPRAERLGFLKQKGKEKKRAEPKTRIGSVSCPVASSPDPNVRLKFEKPALDLSAIRQFGKTYRRGERTGRRILVVQTGRILVVQTVWADKIQSTTDARSLNTFGRNEIEVAPISSALLRIVCLVILYKTCAWRAERGTPTLRCGTTTPFAQRALAESNGPNGEGLKDQTLHEPYRTEHKVSD